VRLAFAFASMLVLSWGAAARAQPRNEPLAEKLYLEGQKLMAKGDAESLREACEKLEASQRLDPGLGTLLNLATCHERQGKIASAWSEFTEAAALAEHAHERDREQFARGRVTALEKRLPKLRIDLPPGARDAEVRLDTQTLPTAAAIAEIPLDPGDHAIEVSLRGKRKWTRTITVSPDAAETRVSVQLADEEPESVMTATTEAPNEDRVHRADARNGAGSRRTIGIALAGAGALAVAFGVVFAVRAWTLKGDSDDEAKQAAQADSLGDAATHTAFKHSADTDYSSALTSQTIAFIAGGAGIAAIGAGVALLVWPGARAEVKSGGVRAAPVIERGSGGVRVITEW
jgi:hypothetical protein